MTTSAAEQVKGYRNPTHTVNVITTDMFTRINNDTNGNPRYVIHFLNLLNENDEFTSLDERYALALKRAKKIGGRKFHNKQYGGGIVFQSYNLQTECRNIEQLLNEADAAKG